MVERIHGKDEVSGSSPDRGSIFISEIMLRVAKVLIKNEEDKYLIVYRNNHPLFGDSIDIPGGTLEKGESIEQVAIREVKEECDIDLTGVKLMLLISTTKYSRLHNEYNLFAADLDHTPAVTLSWEHKAYAWMTVEEIINESQHTNDRFLHMAADILRSDV